MTRKRYTISKRVYFPGGWTIRDNKTGKNLDDAPRNRLEKYKTFTRTEAIEWMHEMNRLNPTFEHDIEGG